MPHRLGKWHKEQGKDGVFHLIPDGDTMNHSVNQCICKPELDWYPIGFGRKVWISTHKAADHREDRFRNNEQSNP